jgi:hypothetical protein
VNFDPLASTKIAIAMAVFRLCPLALAALLLFAFVL